ncbi:MAG TPA: TonB family protein [Pyrinomonadaceae bacterium]|nr:TonB family protein [Pyrinomonadaceae bacterium]
MFDRLVESEQKGAVKSRRSYFTLTTFAVATLSLTAIVVSIFADDFSIGTRNIELVELIAPVEMADPAPQPKAQPRQPVQQTQQTTAVPQRTVAMARVDDTRVVPTTVSTTPNRNLSIPDDGRFTIGKFNTNPTVPAGDAGRGPATGIGAGNDTTGIASTVVAKTETEEVAAPRAEVKKGQSAIKSGGVLNGKAIDLPKPTYSAAAKAVHAGGTVTVQVMLDESGRVVSASALGGHVLLRAAALDAARRARFSPTLLSGVPVKVTGVIVYNFVV